MGSESDSAMVDDYVLGSSFEIGSDSITEGCFWFSTSLSIEGNFQHYARLLRSMYTKNEDTPSSSAQILHRCNIGLILDLVLLLVRSILLTDGTVVELLADIVVGIAAMGDSVAAECSALFEHTAVEAE